MDRSEQNNRIKEAIQVAKQGDLPRARQMITEIVDHDPENDQALLAYAFIAPNKLEAEQVLEEVLRINPNNITALKQLSKLREEEGQSPQMWNRSSAPFKEKLEQKPAFSPGSYPVDEINPAESVFTTEQTAPVEQVQEAEPDTSICIQCGKPALYGSNYCQECKHLIHQKQQAIENPLGAVNSMELEKKINELISVQKEQQQELKKISRAAQLYFWLTIVGFVLSLGYMCFVLFGLTSLLGGAGGFDFPTQ